MAGSPAVAEATLLAVGDVMAHMPQLPAYYNKTTKSYDFSPWFGKVAPLLRKGDWVVANLETPLAGADLKYSGFPRFNAPSELAKALAGAGVQLVSTANNHAMDRGFAGIVRTLANVRKANLVPFGTSASEQEANRLVIEERNGIKLGFLARTYGTNGIPIPADKPYTVDLIDLDDLKGDIAALRAAGADAVSVSLHFGTEYQRLPNDEQKRIVRSAIASGADIVLGSHPHVVQPYDVINIPATESFDGRSRSGVVIYSMGNFISNQTGPWQNVGLIFGVRLTKTAQADGTFLTRWDNVTLTPTQVHIDRRDGKRHYTVLPMEQTLKTRNFATLTSKDYAAMTERLKQINAHLLRLRNTK